METISITGLIATTPRHLVTQDGLPITSFRLASSQRRFDKGQNKWVDGETNWYTITSFKTLAINTAKSLNKGDRIMVEGKLRIRDWDNGERAGTSVEVEADSIGHDLSWGESIFKRTVLRQDLEEENSDETIHKSKELEIELAKTKEELSELRDLLGELAEGRA